MAAPGIDQLAATLAEAKRIADGLQFACRIPDKVPDFTACGGPAAEAYWAYFTPARISSLLGVIEAALELHSRWEVRDGDDGEGEFERAVCRHCCASDGGGQTEDCAVTHMADECWPCPTYRAITAALAGKEDGDAQR